MSVIDAPILCEPALHSILTDAVLNRHKYTEEYEILSRETTNRARKFLDVAVEQVRKLWKRPNANGTVCPSPLREGSYAYGSLLRNVRNRNFRAEMEYYLGEKLDDTPVTNMLVATSAHILTLVEVGEFMITSGCLKHVLGADWVVGPAQYAELREALAVHDMSKFSTDELATYVLRFHSTNHISNALRAGFGGGFDAHARGNGHHLWGKLNGVWKPRRPSTSIVELWEGAMDTIARHLEKDCLYDMTKCKKDDVDPKWADRHHPDEVPLVEYLYSKFTRLMAATSVVDDKVVYNLGYLQRLGKVV